MLYTSSTALLRIYFNCARRNRRDYDAILTDYPIGGNLAALAKNRRELANRANLPGVGRNRIFGLFGLLDLPDLRMIGRDRVSDGTQRRALIGRQLLRPAHLDQMGETGGLRGGGAEQQKV